MPNIFLRIFPKIHNRQVEITKSWVKPILHYYNFTWIVQDANFSCHKIIIINKYMVQIFTKTLAYFQYVNIAMCIHEWMSQKFLWTCNIYKFWSLVRRGSKSAADSLTQELILKVCQTAKVCLRKRRTNVIEAQSHWIFWNAEAVSMFKIWLMASI